MNNRISHDESDEEGITSGLVARIVTKAESHGCGSSYRKDRIIYLSSISEGRRYMRETEASNTRRTRGKILT